MQWYFLEILQCYSLRCHMILLLLWVLGVMAIKARLAQWKHRQVWYPLALKQKYLLRFHTGWLVKTQTNSTTSLTQIAQSPRVFNCSLYCNTHPQQECKNKNLPLFETFNRPFSVMRSPQYLTVFFVTPPCPFPLSVLLYGTINWTWWSESRNCQNLSLLPSHSVSLSI